MTRNKKRAREILLVILLVIIVIYCIGIYYFTDHLLVGSIINNVDCSWLNEEKTIEKINEQINTYEIIVKERNNVEFPIVGKEIDLTTDIGDEIKKIIEQQNKYWWMRYLFKGTTYDMTYQIGFDKNKLYQILDNRDEFQKKNMILPVNAQIGEYDEQTKSYKIIPEIKGTYIYRYKVYKEIEKAIQHLDSEIEIEKINGYRFALINENDEVIKEPIQKLNKMVSTQIKYQFGDKEEILDGDIINEWIVKNDNEIILNEEAVLEYVKDLSRKYDTAFRKHNFITNTGDAIVIDKGHYGWWMDRKEETNQLIEAIKNGEKTIRKPVYIQEAVSYGDYDYGNTYMEIDLTKQHLYFFFEGKVILDSDFVSGNVMRGNATPDGIYPITYKERNATLKGADYANDVSYWMPFNGGIGMHDAPWRNKFGGKIYLTNGSHGCINLPVDIAGQIFEQVYTGMPVICYYSKDE